MYKTSNIQLRVPKGLRKGQTIFNFLEWLRAKGYPNDQSSRMADIFHIQDREFEKLYREFIKDK
jgi:type III secretory pathway lipoprotein EscJ